MAQENKLVTEFQKNDIELVRIGLTKYKGKDFFDLRLYYRIKALSRNQSYPMIED